MHEILQATHLAAVRVSMTSIPFHFLAQNMLLILLLLMPITNAESLLACGNAFYQKSQYTCFDGNFLCPVVKNVPTLRCGPACYLESAYSCRDGQLIYPPVNACQTMTQVLTDGPYTNYFISDCHGASTVVVTSPLPESNLTIIGPRLLVGWPAGNSGTAAWFSPTNGINGTLSLKVQNDTLSSVYRENYYGISTIIQLNDSAILDLTILGSIRTIRDFVEGPSLLTPRIQQAIRYEQSDRVEISRLWLDNITMTRVSFEPLDGSDCSLENDHTVKFSAGSYKFNASFNYPQLKQLSATKVLNNASQQLIQQNPDSTTSLSFLSYSTKLLAGTWRFLTYFGRDSMISLLLLQDVLSQGAGSATEAVISAVLERINRTDGSACHEETIGDYATYLNEMNNITSTAPVNDYKMIDTDFYLPIILQNYFSTQIGQARQDSFLATKASINPANSDLTYRQLAEITISKIINITTPFTQQQTEANLIHLKEGQIVGEWRDSTYGIGGGRIPYDVNTALVPAALNAIAELTRSFPDHPEWSRVADNAKIWEDNTLSFFAVTVPASTARSLVENYTSTADFGFPSNSELIMDDIQYDGLALQGNSQPLVKVMNTDDCFRHFLLNTTNQSQLTAFINQTANNILNPYPVGLSNPIGLLVANPAYGGDAVYAANFSNNAYHGTVCWGWQMAMMAAGIERQIARCSLGDMPDFCNDDKVYSNMVSAYNHLWDLIEANSAQLSSEVWSWSYDNGFKVESLGALPPPAGVNPTESDIRQLWSLGFLGVRRDRSLI